MPGTFSLKDVAEHSSKESPWFIIKDKVYDVTTLLSEVQHQCCNDAQNVSLLNSDIAKTTNCLSLTDCSDADIQAVQSVQYTVQCTCTGSTSTVQRSHAMIDEVCLYVCSILAVNMSS